MKQGLIFPIKKLNKVEEEFFKIIKGHENDIIKVTIIEFGDTDNHQMMIFEF